MVRGIESERKHKHKKKGFWWKNKDMFNNKRAVESYCNIVGTRTEEKMKKSRKNRSDKN